MKQLIRYRGNSWIICGLFFCIAISCSIGVHYDETLSNAVIYAINCLPVCMSIVALIIKKTRDDSKDAENDQETHKQLENISMSWPNNVDIKNQKGLHILTGKSGAGKTHLLRNLFFADNYIDNFEVDSTDECSYVNRSYYASVWNDRYAEFRNKRYLVFDQFERALASSDSEKIITGIKELLKNKNILVIIAVKNTYLADAIKAFKDKLTATKIGNAVGFLDLTQANHEELKQKLAKNENDALWDMIESHIKNNTITFEQLSLIYKFGIQKSDLSNDTDIDAVIRNHIKACIDDLSNPKLAYMILYLLCLDQTGTYISRRHDFQYISFQSKKAIEDTLTELVNIGLIANIHPTDDIRSKDKECFVISHDYLFSLFENLFNSETISSEIRNNIEYYHNNLQEKHDSKTSKELDKQYNPKKIIHDAYTSVWEKPKRYIGAELLLVIMILGFWGMNVLLALYFSNSTILPPGIVVFLNNWNCLLLYNNNPLYAYITLVFVNIVVFMSTFYVYNYYCRILRIIKIKLMRLTIFAGALLCCASYVLMRVWAVCLGIEIIIFGVLTWLCLSRKVRHGEKRFFEKLGIATTISGITTCFLGCFFRIYTGNVDFLALGFFPISLPLFLLYGAFMAFCIRNHLLNNNDLMILGKALFNAEKP